MCVPVCVYLIKRQRSTTRQDLERFTLSAAAGQERVGVTLAGNFGRLGLVHVVVGSAIRVAVLSRVAAAAAPLIGVRARAVAIMGVGARAVAVDAGARGGAGTGQAGHAGSRHVSHSLNEVLESFRQLCRLVDLGHASTVSHLKEGCFRWVQLCVALHHSIHGRRTIADHQQRRALESSGINSGDWPLNIQIPPALIGLDKEMQVVLVHVQDMMAEFADQIVVVVDLLLSKEVANNHIRLSMGPATDLVGSPVHPSLSTWVDIDEHETFHHIWIIQSKAGQHERACSGPHSDDAFEAKVFQHQWEGLSQLVHRGVLIPTGKGVCSLVLPKGVDVTHSKVLHNLCHVLMVKEWVPAGFVVQANVMEGKDDWSVPFWRTFHRAMESSMRSLDIMLLDNKLLHSFSQSR